MVAKTNLVSWLNRAATDFRDWVVPPTCAFCGVPIGPPMSVMLCTRCRQALEEPIDPACPQCAMPRSLPGTPASSRPVSSGPAPELAADECRWCRKNRHRFEGAVAWGAYRGILRRAVIRGKQDRWEPLTRAMAALLSEKLAPFAEKWNFDAIIPIPSHWKRRFARSTNGAEILAESIGRTLRIPVIRRRLVACRLAEKQGTLAPKARRRNVRGVFEILPEQMLRWGGPWQLDGQNILLIDDVMTTGATLDEATRVLLRAGAAKVFVAVVARGVGDPLLM